MADNENIVDKLSIEISSDIQNAQSGIEKLKATLASLQEAYDKAGTGGTAVKSNLQNLTDSVNQIAGINSDKLMEASNALKALAKANLKGVSDGTKGVESQSVENIVKLANAFQTFADVPDISTAVKNIRKLATADFSGISSNVAMLTDDTFNNLERLSSVFASLTYTSDVTFFTKQVSKLATADMSGMVSNINTITPDITNKLHTFVAAIATLGATDYFDGIQNAIRAVRMVSGIDFKSFSDNIKNIDENATARLKRFMETMSTLPSNEGVSDTIIQMQSFFSRDYSGFIQFAESASEALPRLAEGIRQFAESAATPGFAEAIDKLSSVSNINFTDMLATVIAMNNSSGATATLSNIVPDVSSEVDREVEETETSLTGFAKVWNNFKTAYASANQFVIDKSTELKDTITPIFDVMKSAGVKSVNMLKDAFTSFGNKLSGLVKPIQQFVNSVGRILKYRAIRFVISEISKAVKEGTDNMYHYSKAIGTDFAKSMDTLATSAFYFKNSVGAMLAPLINAITPAIDKAVDKIVEFNNVINETIAKLTGASTWTRAIKIPKEYAESVEESTKETTKSLKEAKETLKDFQMGFDELNVISDSPISDLGDLGKDDAEKIKEEIDYTVMFEEVAVDVAPWLDAFKAALDNADFYGAGQILGNKIKEIFANLPYEDWAHALADGINNAVLFAMGLLETMPLDELGNGIARFINTLFDDVNFENIGIMIADIKNAIWSGLHELVVELDFPDIGLAFADMFNGFTEAIDFDTMAETIHVGLNGIMKAITTFFKKANVKELTSKFAKALSKFDVGETLSNAGKLIKSGLDFILDAINSFLENVDWSKLGGDLFKGLSDFIFGNDWEGTGNKVAKALGNIASGITQIIGGFAGEAVLNFFEGDEEGLDDWIEWAEKYTSVVEGIKEKWNEIVSVKNEQGFFDFFEGVGGELYDNLHKTDEEFDKVQKRVDEIHETYPSAVQQMKDFFNDLVNTWGEGMDDIVGFFTGMKDAISEKINELSADWADSVTQIKEFFIGVWQGIHDSWTTGITEVKDFAKGLFDAWSDGFTQISDTFSTFYGYWSDGIDQIKEGFLSFVENWKSGVEEIKQFFEGMKDSILKKWDEMSTKMKSVASGITSSIKTKFQNMRDGIVGFVTGLKTTVVNKFDEIGEWLKEWDGFKNLMDYLKSLPERVKEHATDIANAIKSPFDTVPDSLREMANKAIQVVEDLANGIIGGFNGIIDSFRSTISWAAKITGDNKYMIELPKMDKITLPRFANGGFPNKGDLFFANEQGVAEMVGSIGNRTAVANNDQIVDAVSIGVAEATNAILAEYIPQIIEAIMQNKTIEIDGKKISREIDNVKRTSGTTIYSGGVA